MNSSTYTATPDTHVFSIGSVQVTASATRRISRNDIKTALKRHARGDWGNVTTAEWATNDANLRAGRRLLSKYKGHRGYDFWILTDYDRRSTTVF